MNAQEVSDAVYMIEGLANCCDDGGIRDVDVLEQHEREEIGAALRTVIAALSKAQKQMANLRGVLEWIANHRNDHLTDGSSATRACLDEIVNLAAAALSPTQTTPRSIQAGFPTGSENEREAREFLAQTAPAEEGETNHG